MRGLGKIAVLLVCAALAQAALPRPLRLADLDGITPASRAELERALEDPASSAAAAIGLALLSERTGDSDAQRFFDRAVADDAAFRAEAALWLADALAPAAVADRGRRAIYWFGVAREEFRHMRDDRGLARVIAGEARLMNFGPRRRAMFEEALEAAKKGGDAHDAALFEGYLGECLRQAGALTSSIEHLTHATERLDALGPAGDAGKVYAMLALAYAFHGQFREAAAAFDVGEARYQKAGDQIGAMHARIQRAVFGNHDNPARAIALLDDLRRSIPPTAPPGLRLRLAGMAYAYAESGAFAKAAEVAREVIDNFPRRAPPAAYWTLASAQLHLGKYREAVDTATAALEHAEDSLFHRRQSYRWRALAWEKLGQPQRAVADIREALALDNAMRGGLLTEDEWRQAFDDARSSMAHDAIGVLWRAGEIGEAWEAAEAFRARALLDLLAGRDAQHAFGRIATRAEVSEYAGKTKASFLSYWIDADGIYVWAATPDGAWYGAFTPVPRDHVAALVKRAVTFASKPDLGAWRELDRLLMEPMRRYLPPSGKLALVQHGEMLGLPFNALLNARGRYLVEDFSMVSAPAAAILLREPKGASSELVLLGDPVNMPKTAAGKVLAPLPGSRKEIAAIEGLAHPRSTLLGHAAVAARLTDAAQGAGIVHIATHAAIDPRESARSFLALSDGGKLTVADVYGLRWNARLVVLSACRGGSGTVSADGLLGFTRAFLYAGAARVLAPAWDIPDDPTVHLMSAFYRAYLRGAPASEALREAQVSLLTALRSGKVSVETPAGAMVLPEHPALWAGFSLQGLE